MAIRELAAAEVGLPLFVPQRTGDGEVFALSSHRRAREALEFGLAIDMPGFDIFVLGEDRSGRMTATIEFLNRAMAARPAPSDWVYASNFRHPERPRHFRLPAGIGRRFRDQMTALIPQIRDALARAFGSEEYQARARAESERVGGEISQRLERLRAEARAHGLDLVQSPQGALMVAPAGEADGPAKPAERNPQEQEEAGRRLTEQLVETNRWAVQRQAELIQWMQELNRQVADHSISPLLDAISAQFADYRGLARWLTELHVDVLEGLDRFRAQPDPAKGADSDAPELRYAVNLLVDHADEQHPRVVLEANPTYENLFGRIEHRPVQGALRTDITLIRAGSLHRANGGILVLRAEAIAKDPELWSFLKGALRDREIRIEPPERDSGPPIAGVPRPEPIRLELKVVIVGAPRWYYAFFSIDPDFQTYFKVKADIDPDMDATQENIDSYAGLIQRMARVSGEVTCEDAAVRRLLGIASRWAGQRDKLTSRFELIEDLVSEAALFCGKSNASMISEEAVRVALEQRRRRNARIEDRLQDSIARREVMIDTSGAVVGQVNALTIRDMGDYQFGTPARVTARASIGRGGIINIERDIDLAGPIQHKGVMVLAGFITGRFARRIPTSFSCSITFEQSYGGVEGDSASVAELLAILSDLAEVPLRQDLAVTGSVDQRGHTQPVGGVHHKIEGFFKTCQRAGLTGSQGVMVPAANVASLILGDDVVQAVAEGRFHVWSAETVEEAIELFTGMPAGVADAQGLYPEGTVYGRVARQLASFDEILSRRPEMPKL